MDSDTVPASLPLSVALNRIERASNSKYRAIQLEYCPDSKQWRMKVGRKLALAEEPERATSDWPRHGRASQARNGHLYLPMSAGRHTRPVHGRRNREGDSSVPARLLRRGLSSPRLRLRHHLAHVDFVYALRRAVSPARSRPEIQVCGPTANTTRAYSAPVMPPWWPPFFRRSPSARRGFQSLPPADSRPEIQVCGPTAITNRDRTGQAFPKPWWPPFFRRSSPRVSARRRFQSLPPVGRTFFELLRGRLRLPTRWASVLISSQVAPRHVLGRFPPTRRAEGSPFFSKVNVSPCRCAAPSHPKRASASTYLPMTSASSYLPMHAGTAPYQREWLPLAPSTPPLAPRPAACPLRTFPGSWPDEPRATRAEGPIFLPLKLLGPSVSSAKPPSPRPADSFFSCSSYSGSVCRWPVWLAPPGRVAFFHLLRALGFPTRWGPPSASRVAPRHVACPPQIFPGILSEISQRAEGYFVGSSLAHESSTSPCRSALGTSKNIRIRTFQSVMSPLEVPSGHFFPMRSASNPASSSCRAGDQWTRSRDSLVRIFGTAPNSPVFQFWPFGSMVPNCHSDRTHGPNPLKEPRGRFTPECKVCRAGSEIPSNRVILDRLAPARQISLKSPPSAHCRPHNLRHKAAADSFLSSSGRHVSCGVPLVSGVTLRRKKHAS